MISLKTVETIKQSITADELWQMGSRAENYELVRGELIEMTPPGGLHGNSAVNLSALLFIFVKEKKLGVVLVETGYKLAANPDTVRGPDISFLAIAKIPNTGLPAGYIQGAPDLAVEIVSPGDTASEIQNKVQDYLAYGVQLVWIVYPQQHLVIVYYPDGTSRTLRDTDMLMGEPVIPGFACLVGDIFA